MLAGVDGLIVALVVTMDLLIVGAADARLAGETVWGRIVGSTAHSQ